MIPYFEQPRLSLGPITIYTFGVLVALAIWVGAAILQRRSRSEGLDVRTAQRLTTWILVGGFIGAHLVDRFVYFPFDTLADPQSVVRFWEGLSSFGGFAGAVTSIFLFRRKHHLDPVWPYLDVVAYALPFGWIIGRLGCFVAFDHPGSPTSFFLGQQYKDGIVRHNLGLEEAIYTMVLAGAFALLARRRHNPGFFVGWLAILYAPFRFALDFLRKIDVRYVSLTPGQYGSIVVLIVGVIIVARAGRQAPA